MRHIAISLLILLIATTAATAQEAAQGVQLKPLPVSGKVELYSIEHHRSIQPHEGFAFPRETLWLKLWLASREKDRTGPFLMRLVEIDPIEDDTGKLLSTVWVKRDWNFLHEYIPTKNDPSENGKLGPVLSFELAPPARNATKIKSLKGKAIVAKTKYTALGFAGAMTFRDKPLEHPELKDFPIRASIRIDDPVQPVVTALLKVPRYASRIHQWGLAKNGKLLSFFGSGADFLEGRRHVDYHGQNTTDSLLAIILADPIEPEEFAFEFKDLELP